MGTSKSLEVDRRTEKVVALRKHLHNRYFAQDIEVWNSGTSIMITHKDYDETLELNEEQSGLVEALIRRAWVNGRTEGIDHVKERVNEL